ncbi:MAG: DinB family protein [Acidimicrobiales bacterium]
MTHERIKPPRVADERTMLEAWLEWHRGTLSMKCEGLGSDQLRERAVPPSSMSLLGLVRHMAEVESGWFRNCLAGEGAEPIYSSKEDPDGDFDGIDGADPDADMKRWRDECDHARSVLAAIGSLDDVGKGVNRGEISARWVLVHMIEEYARHNGHADLLRERIDGSTGY